MPGQHKHIPGTAHRRNYSLNNIELALQAVVDGGMSFGQAASKYGVPKTTIYRKYRGQHSDILGIPPILGILEEKKIVESILHAAIYGYLFTIKDLKEFIQQYLNRKGVVIPCFHDNLPGDDWTTHLIMRELNDPEQLETFDEPLCRSYECYPLPVRDDICNVTGSSLSTFDGTEYKYDICNHVIARDLQSKDWDVSLVKNCSEICSRDLVVRHGSQLVKMFSDLSIEFNGYRYTGEQTSRIGTKNLAFVVSRMGDTLLFVSNHYGFWLMWNK